MTLRQSVITRLNWPARTSFIHVEDVGRSIVAAMDNPPIPGVPKLHLLATESLTFAEVSQMFYSSQAIPYYPIGLPHPVWHGLGIAAHCFSRCFGGTLPSSIFNNFWRLDLIANPIFDCVHGDFQRLTGLSRYELLQRSLTLEPCSQTTLNPVQ